MKLLFLTKYGKLGASSRCRYYQYYPFLEAQDISCQASSLFTDEYLRVRYSSGHPSPIHVLTGFLQRLLISLRCARYDLIVIENELFPWFPAWGEALFKYFGVPYVVDYDDAIFHKYDMHNLFVVRALLGKKIDAVMRRASLVLVGNAYLADRATIAGARRVEILPTVVDLERYSLNQQSQNKIFTIGWVGTPMTEKYLSTVSLALAEVCKDGKGKVVLVGARSNNLQNVPAEVRLWSQDTEVDEIRKFDVGIMPLPDTPWERGKCGYKLIQYMATGKPVVASPVGVNKQIVENGVNGFLASSTEDWVRALRSIRDNKQLITTMGIKGRIKVEKEYSLQAIAPKLAALLRSIVLESH